MTEMKQTLVCAVSVRLIREPWVLDVQETERKYDVEAIFVPARQLQGSEDDQWRDKQSEVGYNVDSRIGVPHRLPWQAVSVQRQVPKGLRWHAGEDLREDEPDPIDCYGNEHAVVNLAHPRGLKDADVQTEDGYFAQGVTGNISGDAEEQSLYWSTSSAPWERLGNSAREAGAYFEEGLQLLRGDVFDVLAEAEADFCWEVLISSSKMRERA